MRMLVLLLLAIPSAVMAQTPEDAYARARANIAAAEAEHQSFLMREELRQTQNAIAEQTRMISELRNDRQATPGQPTCYTSCDSGYFGAGIRCSTQCY